MLIRVTGVFVPGDSTLGLGRGIPVGDETKLVYFAGDWRAMAGLALAAMNAEAEGESIEVEVADWQILVVRELP